MKHIARVEVVVKCGSHPAGVRGLKLYKGIEYEIKHVVAPRRGAWIETSALRSRSLAWRVAPRRGAWIETLRIPEHITAKGCRTPQGCVD